MRRRPLLVGEAPPHDRDDFESRSISGRRLDELMHGAPFDAINLLARPISDEDAWPIELARERARHLYEDCFAEREVVLLGRRVARAFARLSPWMDSLASAEFFSLATPTVPSYGDWVTCMVWIAPHPSGRSRWWNRPEHRRSAEAFFSTALGALEFPEARTMPSPLGPDIWKALSWE